MTSFAKRTSIPSFHGYPSLEYGLGGYDRNSTSHPRTQKQPPELSDSA